MLHTAIGGQAAKPGTESYWPIPN